MPPKISTPVMLIGLYFGDFSHTIISSCHGPTWKLNSSGMLVTSGPTTGIYGVLVDREGVPVVGVGEGPMTGVEEDSTVGVAEGVGVIETVGVAVATNGVNRKLMHCLRMKIKKIRMTTPATILKANDKGLR